MANEIVRFSDRTVNALVQQVKQKQELGMTFPSDYNPANELNGAYLVLKGAKDKNNRPVLETCSQESICASLMFMVNSKLSMMKGQCYPIAYGGTLNIQPSVYGNTCNARRYGMKDISASPIYKGDVFKFHVEDGRKVIDTHEMSLENIDIENIVGAYAVAIMKDGTKRVEIMTMSQIKQAWKQGFGYKEGGNGTHQKFTDQMCEKTVKNRLLKHIIRTYGEPEVTEAYEAEENIDYSKAVEVDAEYEVKENANKVEFPVEAEVEVVEAEVVEPTFMEESDPE